MFIEVLIECQNVVDNLHRLWYVTERFVTPPVVFVTSGVQAHCSSEEHEAAPWCDECRKRLAPGVERDLMVTLDGIHCREKACPARDAGYRVFR